MQISTTSCITRQQVSGTVVNATTTCNYDYGTSSSPAIDLQILSFDIIIVAIFIVTAWFVYKVFK